jgi:hypothetical protein
MKKPEMYPIDVIIVAVPETAGSALYGTVDTIKYQWGGPDRATSNEQMNHTILENGEEIGWFFLRHLTVGALISQDSGAELLGKIED